mgnify:FL=1
MSEYEAIQQQIAELQRKAASIRAVERAAALANIKSLMATFDITAHELSGKTPTGNVGTAVSSEKKRSQGSKVPAKYRDATGNVWSGRGLKPRWLRDAVASGATVESFLIG